MQLKGARALALRIVDAIAPYCQQIEIAGSIRRERPEVSDIDLVLIPTNLPAILERVSRTCKIVRGGLDSVNIAAQFGNGFQLDLFIAHDGEHDMFDAIPSNWGTTLLVYTGSKAHNINLAAQATARGLHLNARRGIEQGGKVIASRTEQEIYEAIGMEWRPPTERG
jgi:DNA polymerase (family 10)